MYIINITSFVKLPKINENKTFQFEDFKNYKIGLIKSSRMKASNFLNLDLVLHPEKDNTSYKHNRMSPQFLSTIS